jgi:CheY-like chemotaxis protein
MSCNILLVDDIEENRKIASLMLNKLGYRADLATNGVEAIEALENKPYDILLMDIQMPEMDGLEATRIIRKRWNDGPWIVIVTALDISRNICLDSGADEVLAKPLRIGQLRDAIKCAMPISSFSMDGLEASLVCATCRNLSPILTHT